MHKRSLSAFDRAISTFDQGIKTLTKGAFNANRKLSAETNTHHHPVQEEKKHIAGLMRINHTGEVCAQALYQGQALTAKNESTRTDMQQAADEEIDHLVWCEERLEELDSQPSVLNPLFYGMSFGVGALAGTISDRISLGFVAATEEQVCVHLEKHLRQIPESDKKTREILEQMLIDEESHAIMAKNAGGVELPYPIKACMKLMSKVMTSATYKL